MSCYSAGSRYYPFSLFHPDSMTQYRWLRSFCSDGTNDGVMRRWYSKMILLDSMAAIEWEANTWKDDPLFRNCGQKSSIVLSFVLRHSLKKRCSFVNERKCGKIFQACRKIGSKHILPRNYIRKLTHLLAMAQVENAGKDFWDVFAQLIEMILAQYMEEFFFAPRLIMRSERH